MAILVQSPGFGRAKARSSKRTSIREICLIAESVAGEFSGIGEPILRKGRTYQVAAVQDGGDGPSIRYLHLKLQVGVRSDA